MAVRENLLTLPLIHGGYIPPTFSGKTCTMGKAGINTSEQHGNSRLGSIPAPLAINFKNVLKMFVFNFSSAIIGFCLGIIIMGIIADKVNKAQKKEHEEELEAVNLQASTLEVELEKLEAELSVQKNVVKTLSENNQRLLKSNQQLKKENSILRS